MEWKWFDPERMVDSAEGGHVLDVWVPDKLDMNHGGKEGAEHSLKNCDLRDGLNWSKPGLWGKTGQFSMYGIHNSELLTYTMLPQKGTQAIISTKNVKYIHNFMPLNVFQSGQLLFSKHWIKDDVEMILIISLDKGSHGHFCFVAVEILIPLPAL